MRNRLQCVKSAVLGLLTAVTVESDDLIFTMHFLIVEGSPLDVIIGDPDFGGSKRDTRPQKVRGPPHKERKEG